MIVGTWSGQEAADLRAALRWPITKFARDLGIAEGTVSKWERMLRGIVPTPLLQGVLDEVLRTAPPETQDRFALLSCLRRTAPGGPVASCEDAMGADLNRRELLRLLSIAAPAVAIGHAVEGSDQEASGDLMAEYGDASARLWRIYAQAVPKSAVLPLVNDQLRIVTARLRHGGQDRQRLCALASELFQLAGEIFFDQDRYGDAAHCYTMAATAAQEAKAADLWACALTRHSFIYVYGRGFGEAMPMLDFAAGIARDGDWALSTRQWVSVVQAQACAGLGNMAQCQRALDSAEKVLGLSGTVHNGGWLRFDGTRLPEERGACYAELGRPDLAAAALQSALVGRLSSRRRGSVHADLARAALQRRDADEFVAHALVALDLAGETQSGFVARRLRGLQPYAAPFLGNPGVADACDRIAALKTDQAA
jgi:transcriptional regulator with XRE-family HTH domain